MQPASYKLQVTSNNLRVTSYMKQFSGYIVTSYKLQVASCNLQVIQETSYKL